MSILQKFLQGTLILLLLTSAVVSLVPTEVFAQGTYQQASTVGKAGASSDKVPVARTNPMSLWNFSFESFLAWVALAILSVMAGILWVAGGILDGAIQYFVVGMADWVNSNAAVNLGWSVMRDIANSVFLFMLVYIGIMTILKASSYQWKKMLFYVIVAAILVNFSMLLAKVVIDVSNVTSVEIYKAMALSPECYDNNVDNDVGACIDRGMASAFLDVMGITSFVSAITFDGQPVTNASGKAIDGWLLMMVCFIAIPFFLLVAFVFAAGGILLTMRLVTLIIVIIFSPLAFAAFVLPGFQKQWTKWLNALIYNSFFAPLYLLMLWLALKTIEGMNAAATTGGAAKGSSAQSSTFFLAIAGQDSSSIRIVLTFAIISVFLVYSLILPRTLGAMGASTVIGYGNSWRKKAWVYTKGRGQATGAVAYDFTAGAAARKVAGYVGRAEQRTDRAAYNPVGWAYKFKSVSSAAQSMGKNAKERAERLQKRNDKFSTKELGRQEGRGILTSPSQKASVLQTAAKRGQVHELNAALIESGLEAMKRLNMDTSAVLRQAPYLVKKKAGGKEVDEQLKDIMTKQTPEQIRQMNVTEMMKSSSDDSRKPDGIGKEQLLEGMLKNYNGNQAGILMGEWNDVSKEFVEQLRQIGIKLEAVGGKQANTLEGIAEHLEKNKDKDKMTPEELRIGEYNNRALAGWLKSGTARPILSGAGLKSRKDLEEEEAKAKKAKEEADAEAKKAGTTT